MSVSIQSAGAGSIAVVREQREISISSWAIAAGQRVDQGKWNAEQNAAREDEFARDRPRLRNAVKRKVNNGVDQSNARR